MNIWQLKEYILVNNLPDDMIIIHRWYEDWYDPSSWANVMEVKLQEWASWYNWKYTDGNDKYSNTEIIKALYV